MPLIVLPDQTSFDPEMVVAVWEDHTAEVTKIHLMYGHTAETSTSAEQVNDAISRLIGPPGPEKALNAQMGPRGAGEMGSPPDYKRASPTEGRFR